MTVVGVGELLWDCFASTRRPGGAPANVAYHAQLLGNSGLVLSRVGDDALGEELCQHLAANSLSTEYIQIDQDHPTSTVTVDQSDLSGPRFTIHENVSWDYFEPSAQWQEAVSTAQAICFGTLAQRSDESRITIQALISSISGALRIYDVNIRPPWYSRDIIEYSLRHADIVKLNQDEVSVICELFKLSPSADELMNRLAADTPVRTLCVTQGAAGCLVLTADQRRIDVTGEPVTVVDTVGSGDAFTAAFIHGMINNWPIENTATFANRVGGIVAAHQGAMPDVAAKYQALLDECSC